MTKRVVEATAELGETKSNKRQRVETDTLEEARSRFRNKDGLPDVTFKAPLRGVKRAKLHGQAGQPIG